MRLSVSAALVVLAAQAAFAQGGAAPVGSSLSLDEAITIARQNNPTYLQSLTARRTADAQVRSAYGAFLPSANASFGGGYQQGGKQVFNGLAFSSSSDAVQSFYSLSLQYSLSAATFLNPVLQRANRAATEADIAGNAEALRANVTTAYLNALQARARAQIQDSLVLTAQTQLDLAKAKLAVGSGTSLDVRNAEVALGQAQVQAMTEKNNADVAMVQLFSQLGVPPQSGVSLATNFAVGAPAFSLDSVLDLARAHNPAVAALRSREHAATIGVRTAKARYTPTLSLSTGLGGNSYQYTNSDFLVGQAMAGAMSQQASCIQADSIRARVGLASYDCSRFTLSSAQVQSIRDANNVFPFRFTRAPMSFNATLSLPLFDGFNREQNVEQARATEENAQYSLRARELQLTSDVTQAYLNLSLAARTVALRQSNAAAAREALQFAEERYRVGSATFLDVLTARCTYAQAEMDRVNSIYDYHKAFAALESAVGRPLR
jgi:outer membrane protein